MKRTVTLAGYRFGRRYKIRVIPGSISSRFYRWYSRKFKVPLQDCVPLTEGEKAIQAAYLAGFAAGRAEAHK